MILNSFRTLLILGSIFAAHFAVANGIITVESERDFATTQQAFADVVKAKGFTLFHQIDHQANAQGQGLEILPSVVFVFGNPKIGTKLMQCQPSVALDLPQKMHIWQDASQKVWLSYNDPQYLLTRHQLDACAPVLVKIQSVLMALSQAAAQTNLKE